MSEYELSLMTVIVIFIVVAIAFTGVFPIGLANGMNAKPPENCNLKAEADGDGDSISAELDLYQFSQPEHLYAVDLRDADIETLVLLTSLQGVVNRKKPRIFVLTNEKNVSGEIVCYENLWLEYYQKEKEIDYTLVENAFSLLAMFENEVGGYVIYDPAFPDSFSVAAMKASLTGALVSHPEHAGLLDNLGYSMVEDFRGRWESRVEMVDYSIREFWPKMRQTLLVNEDYQSGLSCLDYLIASRGFVFTLNPAVQDEREMASRVYRMAPQHSILFGWPADEEVRTVSAASEHNLLVLCDGGAANLSVHAGVPALLFGCIKRVEKVSRKRVIAIMATCFAIIVAITVPVLYYVPEALSKTEFHRLVWLAKSALGRLG